MCDHQQRLRVGVDDDRRHQPGGIETREKSVGRIALLIHARRFRAGSKPLSPRA
jgi:hypothetical protein